MNGFEKLRRLLDPAKLPRKVRDGDFLIIEGKIYEFVSDDPQEECVRKATYSGALQ
jgi:hypothetical protein